MQTDYENFDQEDLNLKDRPLSLRRDQVPQGPILQGPETRRDRRFAYAIPMMATLFGLSAVTMALAAVFASYTLDLAVSLPVTAAALTLVLSVGLVSAPKGWFLDRRAGPWRPMLQGLAAGGSVVMLGLVATCFGTALA